MRDEIGTDKSGTEMISKVSSERGVPRFSTASLCDSGLQMRLRKPFIVISLPFAMRHS